MKNKAFIPPSKDLLIEEYIVKRKTMKQVASDNGYSVGTIYNFIKKYGISSRPAMTEETRKKISVANKGHKYSLGRKVSEETKIKISKANKGRVYKPTKYGGHAKKRTDGYIYVYKPNHPHSSQEGYVMEHVLVMEKTIGRYLNKGEVVHHKNHVRDDNRIENLQLMTFKEHARFHMNERWAKKRGVKDEF